MHTNIFAVEKTSNRRAPNTPVPGTGTGTGTIRTTGYWLDTGTGEYCVQYWSENHTLHYTKLWNNTVPVGIH